MNLKMKNVVKDLTYKKKDQLIQTVTITNDGNSKTSSIILSQPIYGVNIVKAIVKYPKRSSITLTNDGFGTVQSSEFSLAAGKGVTFELIYRLQESGAYDVINFFGILALADGGNDCYKYANVKVRLR